MAEVTEAPVEFIEVTVKKRKYRISKFTAMNGSWIAMTVMTKLLPMGIAAKAGIPLAPGSASISEAEFHNIQAHCLNVCARINEQGNPEPVLFHDGRFTFKDMEHDLILVMGLTIHALRFNIAPFFEEGALKEALGPEFMTFLNVA